MNMEFTTYALKSLSKNYIYVGLTNDLERRLAEHNSWKNRSTRNYTPFRIIYQKNFETRPEARKHEKKLKSGYWKEYLKSLEKNWNNLY